MIYSREPLGTGVREEVGEDREKGIYFTGGDCGGNMILKRLGHFLIWQVFDCGRGSSFLGSPIV